MNLAAQTINLGPFYLAAVIAGGGMALCEGIAAWRRNRRTKQMGEQP